MNPGKLDRRITIQVRTYTRDASNTKVETWANQCSVWAEYVSQRGKESEIAGADRSQENQQFRIRYRSIAPGTHRIRYSGKTYDIVGIAEEGRQQSLLLDCVSIQALV